MTKESGDCVDVKELKKKLLIPRTNGFFQIEEKKVEEAACFAEEYKRFLDASKTEREAVAETVRLAKEKGFVAFEEGKKYNAGDRVYYNNRNKSVILMVVGEQGCKDGVRISVAHIDSPRLDLKPHPLYESNDIAFFKTHYYGGIKKYQWTAVPLAMHGVLVRKDGTSVSIVIGEEEEDPQFCVTDLLPHLSTEQMSKVMHQAISAEDLNILVGSRPIADEEGGDMVKLNVMRLLNEKYGITEEDFVSADIEFVPAMKARDIGFDRSLIGAYGHDDRVCAYPAVMATLNAETPKSTVLTVLADREEIGSSGNTGMESEFLYHFVEDIAQAEGLEARYVLRRSKCLSADVTAAYDPNFSNAYDVNNSCMINSGVSIVKYTGSRGKSGTSEASAELMAEVRSIFEKNDVLWQTGEMGKVDNGGGGTVAMYIANRDVEVIDIGVPVLSMHAPMEVISKTDLYMTYLGIKAFFQSK